MTLNDITPGGTCRVVKLAVTGQTRRRIMDMGITQGTVVHVNNVAPLDDPVDLTVRGYHLSLRRSDLRHIEVEPLDGTPEPAAAPEPAPEPEPADAPEQQ